MNSSYTARIQQSIAANEHKAVTSANSHTTAVINAQDDILHRRLKEIVPAHIAIPGWAESTIPIALAGVIAAVLPIADIADTCLNPMCSDYAAATAALSSLLAGLGAVGALEFLVQAITNPESFGSQVAGYADSVGNDAVRALGGILQLPTSELGGLVE